MSPTVIDAGRQLHILIVDDEVHNRNVLEVMLKQEGYVIESAASGAEALALMAQRAPDLVLLDVIMPRMGGYELAYKIKSNGGTKNIPIIMVTALDDREAKMSGLSAGAEDFLSKPVDRAELCARVRNLLRLKACADESIAQRDASMGMVSHELRNVLNCILLKTEMLSNGAAGSDEGRTTVAAMHAIQAYAVRMNRLVEDLIDVASINAGRLGLRAEPCDAFALITEAIEAYASAASEKGITLELAIIERALTASFDRERVLQVLTNLITNALKFTGRGGAVEIRGECSGSELRISVRDTGAGIPDEMLESVFERFLQIRKSDRRGLGLGLYISRCIVESHGGRMWAESKLGEGSTFHFTIPRSARAQPSDQASAAS